jgi:GrpB-like predicted nucleotidyltransferase (UPF0157 family)
MGEFELIGGREARPVVIADYDPAWTARFVVERERIRTAIGATALQVEHIGSTSVPGLAAKPVVDILVVVEEVDDDTSFCPALEAAGYRLRVREPGHRMFRTPERDVHVHVWQADDDEVAKYLLFRDWLRASPEDRTTYEARKRELAKQDWGDMNDYADAKTDAVNAILARARAWRSGSSDSSGV